ncbi:MAG: alpha-mannosidase [Ilumatobacteraceae bacterium]|nr:alpha-mannosidase [Ilumatobacteraceae bacterium]
MAHRVTAPAIQRARRLLDQRITPFITSGAINFTVTATEEWFESPGYDVAVASPVSPFVIGSKWGQAWHTRWFHLTAVVPAHLAHKKVAAYVDIGFNRHGDGFQTEALAYINGEIVHAIQPDRRLLHLGAHDAGTEIDIWVEAAATPIIAGHEYGYGPTTFGDPATAPTHLVYTLRAAQLVAYNAAINDLAIALHAVIDLAIDLPDDAPQRARAFAALEQCDLALDVNDVTGTVEAARHTLDAVLGVGNGPSAHAITATGHAHLDTAWLWPIRETRRKAVRTFANAVDLLTKNPDAVYCHSQAQHYAWVAEDAPDIFARVTELVREGRWEVIGGMWVETDLNLPTGESLLRQLVQGQRAFREWFGVTCSGAFLPDDFGYPGSLPQIVAHGECHWFFTQKLSWNETNAFPHHTFWWEGIDGTQVFTHFSPVDTYNAIMTPSQLRFAERNYKDHAGSSHSLVLYGHGDGGGGPTQTMINRGRLASDLENVPRVSFGTVAGFFEKSEKEYGTTAPRWVGEMYFEKHRGTYSTQVGTKQGNRSSERLLHELELWSALARVRPPALDELWQHVLTQQFHDIIPGSSIAWVHDDAEAIHAEVASNIEALLVRVIPVASGDTHILNPAPVALRAVVDIDGTPMWAESESFGAGLPFATLPAGVAPVSASTDDDSITITNGILTVSFNVDGAITRFSNGNRDLIAESSRAEFVMRQDTPAEYDAWDIDMTDANAPSTPLLATAPPVIVESTPLRTTVECGFATEASRFTIRFSLRAGASQLDVSVDADWHEQEKRLQWVLPTDLRALHAICGTQFGHVSRARHANTSWDIARFEVCAHRYVAVSEPSFGVAILADGPRGYDIRGDELQLTVLRSPKFPDPEADLGQQHLQWSVSLLNGDPITNGIEDSAALMAHPVRILDGVPRVPASVISLDVPGALISAVKPADDGSDDIIVRIWETRGGRTNGVLTIDGMTAAQSCNALEDAGTPLNVSADGILVIELQPFEIMTLRITQD